MLATDRCIFCKIIAGELPAKIIHQTDDVMVIQDIGPKAPIHYLIIPKTHISDVQSLNNDDDNIVGKLFLVARDISKNLSGSQAFRLIINNGSDVGQTVYHLHVHFLSGKRMLDF